MFEGGGCAEDTCHAEDDGGRSAEEEVGMVNSDGTSGWYEMI